MTPTALGKLTAAMYKEGSTALVRRIAQGVLSPATIERAAGAMRPGSFRFIRNLGRGQFSLADEVVGNIGGFAGQMARKLPTRAGMTPVSEYGPLRSVANHINADFQRMVPGSAPPIAPFVDVNNRGAFQRLATDKIPVISDYMASRRRHMLAPNSVPYPTLPSPLNNLQDLHSGNVGPGGQIIDFGVDQTLLSAIGANQPTSAITGMANRPLATMTQRSVMPRGFDPLGNNEYQRLISGGLEETLPQDLRTQGAWQNLYNRSNNAVRKYWAGNQTPGDTSWMSPVMQNNKLPSYMNPEAWESHVQPKSIPPFMTSKPHTPRGPIGSTLPSPHRAAPRLSLYPQTATLQ